jgi:hypothetical protein
MITIILALDPRVVGYVGAYTADQLRAYGTAAIEAALAAAPQPQGGWVMVPTQPTEDMFRAAQRQHSNWGRWQAMIAAAPPAPAAQPQGDIGNALRGARASLVGASSRTAAEMIGMIDGALAALYAAPTPPAPAARPTVTVSGVRPTATGEDVNGAWKVAQPSAEPVAWVPVHPSHGPLWAMTTADPSPERLPSYPMRKLFFDAQPSVEPTADDCTPNHLCGGRWVHKPSNELCNRCGHE